MVLSPDEDFASGRLLLEMATEAKIGVASDKHLLVDRAMNCMAGRAAFAYGLVLENKRPALGGMTLTASLGFDGQGCAAAFNCLAFVGIVTIGARDFALENRMVVGEIELAAFIEMTVETNFGRFPGINDGVAGAARLVMDAARSMARFTADLQRIGTLGLQARVCGCREIAGNIAVAFLTALGANERGVWDCRGRDYDPVNGCAGDEQNGDGQRDKEDQNLDRKTQVPGFA
jgi:hypothetical protein